MPDITLAAEARDQFGSRPSGRLRRSGQVPAVVYGLGTDTLNIAVPAHELSHILGGEGGANTLISLQVSGDTVLTLPRQIHRHPTRGEVLHVDFVRVRRDVAVSAEVPLHLVGEAVGVKDGGILDQISFSITVEAMPGNIPVAIEVDVSELALGGQLRIADLPLPAGVTATHDAEELVAQVAIPRGLAGSEEGGEAGVEDEGGEASGSAAEDTGSE